MTVRLTYFTYTDEARLTNIKNGDTREAAAKAAVESAGGKLLGFYGLIGADADVMIITDMEQTDYMGVVGKILLGGAAASIHTVTCYTGEQLGTAMAKATGTAIDYEPAG
ncbi:MAG: GYD domain-containing protein [Alphaproteobacteria bacterium]|nr:GYD domain-containing protein [Alphaproteobacteria bacterium]